MNKFFNNNRYLPALLHILVWAVLFSLPYVLSSGQVFKLQMLVEHSWLPLTLYAVLFYLNYFILVERFLFKKKLVVFFGLNILFIAVFIWIRLLVREILPNDMPGPGRGDGNGPPVKFFIYFDGLSFIIPLIFSITLKIFERWIKTEDEKKEAVNAQLQSELEHLKYQLQPHFFFNSLNNIYSLVDISPERAKETILALSKLMRYLLYEANIEKVPLKKEVEFMQKYVELMQLRTAENTFIIANFGPLPDNAAIAPLLFIPLIENAFKHGVAATQHGEIRIAMHMEGNTVVFETRNNNLPKHGGDRSGSGIGLQNIKKRLQLIYPGAYSFNAGVEGDSFIAKLSIDI